MNTAIPVLVVDDSHTMSVIISDFLRKLGFTDVDLAQDGQSALERLRQKQYGLVLSDWEMQPMGGEQFLKELRQDKSFSRIPVILITGNRVEVRPGWPVRARISPSLSRKAILKLRSKEP